MLFLLFVSFIVSEWADLARGRWPDYFSPLAAGIGLLMAFICADILLPQIKKLPQRRLVRLAWCLAYVACAHALPILLAGLVQIPRVGLQFLPDVLAGVWFTLRQAWLPLLVGSGALYFVFQIRRSAQPVNGETRESRHPPPPEGTRGMP